MQKVPVKFHHTLRCHSSIRVNLDLHSINFTFADAVLICSWLAEYKGDVLSSMDSWHEHPARQVHLESDGNDEQLCVSSQDPPCCEEGHACSEIWAPYHSRNHHGWVDEQRWWAAECCQSWGIRFPLSHSSCLDLLSELLTFSGWNDFFCASKEEDIAVCDAEEREQSAS